MEGVISLYVLGWVFVGIAVATAALAAIGITHDVRTSWHRPRTVGPGRDRVAAARPAARVADGPAGTASRWSAEPSVEKSA